MKDAEKTFGLLIPEREIKRGLVSINKQRTPDWSFVYSYDHRYRPRYGINRPAVHWDVHRSAWLRCGNLGISESPTNFLNTGFIDFVSEKVGLILAENDLFPTRPTSRSLVTFTTTDFTTRPSAFKCSPMIVKKYISLTSRGTS